MSVVPDLDDFDTDLFDDEPSGLHGDEGATVQCHLTGERVPMEEAIQVRLGPGNTVWMLKRFCRDG